MLTPTPENAPQHDSAEPPQKATRKSTPPDPRAGNALRHGLRTKALPKGSGRIIREVNELRASLENAVLASAGKVALPAALAINAACRCEQLSQLAFQWLRKQDDALTIDQRLRLFEVISKNTAKRDKLASRLLGEPATPGSSSAAASLYADEPAQDRTGSDSAPPRVQGPDDEGSHG